MQVSLNSVLRILTVQPVAIPPLIISTSQACRCLPMLWLRALHRLSLVRGAGAEAINGEQRWWWRLLVATSHPGFAIRSRRSWLVEILVERGWLVAFPQRRGGARFMSSL